MAAGTPLLVTVVPDNGLFFIAQSPEKSSDLRSLNGIPQWWMKKHASGWAGAFRTPGSELTQFGAAFQALPTSETVAGVSKRESQSGIGCLPDLENRTGERF